ncbi:hypothetical protein [Brumimicrobium salinarum]|nr:hypothetical protein [Brumimicrobium salinarum]
MSNFVPKELSEFIEKCAWQTLSDVLKFYINDDKKVVLEYLDFLTENDFGFFVSESLKNNFPPINTKLKNSPEIIDNLILDIDSKNMNNLKSINSLIERCLISSIEIRGINLSIGELDQIIQMFSSSVVQSINIYLDSTLKNSNIETLSKIIAQNARIKKLVVFESIEVISSDDGIIHFTSKQLNFDEIRRINNINLSFHLEAQKVCTFRYKKLFIDREGKLKNHPNSKKLIGNIQFDEINILIENLKKECKTNKEWYITKEQINVCKDCEFRTVCFTNNLPIGDKDDNCYLQAECTYNPYIGKGEGEEGYKTLEECGVISNESGFIIDHDKIAEINAELWTEE